MAAARIGNRDTYTAALRTLETFGRLIYQPSHSTNGSRVLMTELTGEVAAQVSQPKAQGCPTNEATAAPEVAAQVGQPVAAQSRQPSPEVAAQVGQHSLLDMLQRYIRYFGSLNHPQKLSGGWNRTGTSDASELLLTESANALRYSVLLSTPSQQLY